jgi:NAD(P)-dependent dehydrogenase (short-subunit alcohol dehydrogenase family)
MESVEMMPAVLVTGGSRGIGRGIAVRLASEGYGIVNLDRAPPKDALENEWYIEVDLSSPEETRAALSLATDGREILRLVNNVGTVCPAPLEQVRIEDLEAVVSLNLRCTIQCTQAVLPAMKSARRGRIVNISSRAALGKELRTVYSATKAGLQGITRTWALELAPYQITVNAIGPGPIGTELFHDVNPADSPRTRAIVERIPLGRMGSAEDIAHAAAFFLDDRASFITGQVLYVCGGLTVGSAG